MLLDFITESSYRKRIKKPEYHGNRVTDNMGDNKLRVNVIIA